MKTITLSGWGQAHDALRSVYDGASHIEYSQHHHIADVFDQLSVEAKDANMVIGWSLGAQLALRAIADQVIQPEKLVLIAPPFQFVEKPQYPFGMKPDTHDKFYHNYQSNPARTLRKAWELVIKDDKHHETVRNYLSMQNKDMILQYPWQAWLEELERFSCDAIDLSAIPPTLLIHGSHDVVVDVAQSHHFASTLPDARLAVLDRCGHAPHWHDNEKVRALIEEHASV